MALETDLKEVMLVLGMHRSGTSALARILNLVGYEAPKNLIKANKTNTSGHWESDRIARLDDALLQDMNSSWDSWRPISELDLSARRKTEFREDAMATLRSEFPGAKYAVLKEPRICRLADFYVDILQSAGIELRVVLPLRNPLEVIASLQSRNAMPEVDAAFLWLRYILDAEKSSRSLNRCFVTYESLLEDGVKSLEHIEQSLGTVFPIPVRDVTPQITSFLAEGLRHHAYKTTDVVHNPVTRGWVSDTYAALLILCENSGSEHALGTLDRVRGEFDGASTVLSVVMASQAADKAAAVTEIADKFQLLEQRFTEERARVLDASSKTQRLEQRLAEATEKIRALEDVKAANATLATELTAARQAGESATAELKSAQKAQESLKAELNKLQKDRWRLQDQLSWNNDLVAAMRASHSWRITAPLRYVSTRLQALRGSSAPAPAPAPAQRNTKDAETGPAPQKKDDPQASANIKLIEKSGLFDTAYYLSHYPEVQVYEGSPVEHYYKVGWTKGFQPSASFNTNAYLAANPHVKAAGACPFVDFINAAAARPTQGLKIASDTDVGRIAVFMAISGPYDELKEPLTVSENADYIVFTDQPVPAHSVWQARPFDFVSSETTRTARYVKTHPQLYFPDYDWAIWVDANLQLNCRPEDIISELGADCELATWRHPLRECVYDEAEECIRRGKDESGMIAAQIAALKARNFPAKSGLFETSVMVSKVSSTRVRKLMNSWWAEIESGSRRDQIGLPIALQDADLKVDYLAKAGICMRTDPRFNYFRHTATS